jgi:hypothetical protein
MTRGELDVFFRKLYGARDPYPYQARLCTALQETRHVVVRAETGEERQHRGPEGE